MAELKLKAKKREVLGKKVKNLRSEGLLPANVYGKKTSSMAVSLSQEEFDQVFEEAGETGVIKLTIEGEKADRPILIQNVQKNPVTNEPIHADLRQIILTEKVTAQIPVELTGEAPAAEQKMGILIQTANELEVEALPMDLPERFIVDVSKLENVGDEVLVKDLSYDKGKIELHAEEDLVLAKIDPLAVEEVEPVAEEAVEGEVAEGEEKAAEGEAKEGEEKAPEGGEEKKEEGGEEKKE